MRESSAPQIEIYTKNYKNVRTNVDLCDIFLCTQYVVYLELEDMHSYFIVLKTFCDKDETFTLLLLQHLVVTVVDIYTIVMSFVHIKSSTSKF